MTKITKNAFTLIELLVIITIIGLTILSGNQIFLSKTQDKQKLDIFTNKIISKIDMAKNYSLVGKGVGINLETPSYWKISFSSGTLGNQVFGYVSTGSTENYYNDLKIYFDKYYTLNKIECMNIDGTNITNISNADLKIEGSNMTLSGCTDSKQKILDLEIGFVNLKSKIRINTINSVVEKK